MKTYVTLAAFIVLALALSPDAVAGKVYQVRSLQTPTGQSSEARTINNLGAAAGAIDYGIGGAPLPVGPCKQATVWDGSNTYALVPEHESWAYANNDMGDVAGWFFDDSNQDHLFLWHSTTGMLDDVGRFNGDIHRMNKQAQIVGLLCDPLAQSTAFIWSQETGFTELAGMDTWSSVAYDINNVSQVVGCAGNSYDDCYAFLWSADAGVTVIAEHADARALNDRGQVVGVTQAGQMFLWAANQGLAVIPKPDGCNGILPTGISNDGVVVGCLDVDGRGEAFAWTAENGFTTLGEGMAFDINDSGQIAGRLLLSHNPDGSDSWQAVLWEPVPEPSSFIILGGLFLLATGFAGRRRQ